ncbi:MAG: hypothetical protein IPL32_18825 [Chloracidobacterium sp.]|nr:hypothetical protein [Chloracidobacterium sp.]
MGQHTDAKRPKIEKMLVNGIISDSDIALCCGVSWKYVQEVKRELRARGALGQVRNYG